MQRKDYWKDVINRNEISETAINLCGAPKQCFEDTKNAQYSCWICDPILERIELTQTALGLCFTQIEKIRHEKLSTHHEAEGTVHLFKKLLNMLSDIIAELGVGTLFWDNTIERMKQVERAFLLVFKALTMGFTKKEKHLLLRSFFEPFADQFRIFCAVDIHTDYVEWYMVALEYWKTNN